MSDAAQRMSRKKGFEAETRACEWLVSRGFEITDRNFQKRFGEIDIVAKKSEVLHFIEVKSGEGFDPIHAFTKAKLKKVVMTAMSYMESKSIDTPFCVDALIVRDNEIELIANVTM
ncbi:MAG: YraN family protein [Helicobacteraceae bacterium]|jgi:putative endonuclease|nr:YraN family protein [Helicobacteraceae bacterium]